MKAMHLPITLSAALLSLTSLASASASLPVDIADVYVPGSCPALCSDVGPIPSNWSQIHSLPDLESCKQTVLFDLNVHNSLDKPGTTLTLRACVAKGEQSYNFRSQDLLRDQQKVNPGTPLLVSTGCGAKAVEVSVTPSVGGSAPSDASSSTIDKGDVVSAAQNIASYLETGAQCATTILFAKSGSVVVGLYSGAQVTKKAARDFLESYQTQAKQGHSSLQVCSPRDAALTLGAYATSIGNLAAAQGVVASWSNGLCLNGSTPLSPSKMEVLVSKVSSNTTSTSKTSKSQQTPNSSSSSSTHALSARADCRTIQVVLGDGCPSLASRCGISPADFTKYNPQADCANLKVNQFVCCSSGTLPDNRPKPQPDGTCFVHTITSTDICYDLANTYFISQSDIESFNTKTWGWRGCGDLQLNQIICLSTGNPPMPATVSGTICGPLVPGTQKPPAGTDISTLNPCPLNACCDVFGYCGTTADFCNIIPEDVGGPGTSNCISNCGMDLVNNGSPPSSFMSVGYFEAFDQERVCLRMDVESIPQNTYTHVHFAFATVDADFDVDISDTFDQFQRFTRMTGFKKILSFGGWAFSTDPDTFQRFRLATNSANRGVFVYNLVNFINANAIDGVDFDWEYPGAPDIPDITPGSPDEGSNHLYFLELLRADLPPGKTISIALPASYWYLQGYPVKTIAPYVDYFIYMTYDLHGQWDVGNKWAIPSCSGGNCLRSHVNKTETLNALVMLTKAGVSSTKIVVGVTSYGRSFRMSDPNCSGPFCQYTGDSTHSGAYPGPCTGTAGYIANSEINTIIQTHSNYSIIKTSVDSVSGSNILMYGNGNAVDWVAYMDGSVKTDRISWIKGLNMAGTTDWAVDLQTDVYDEAADDDDDDDEDDDDESGEDLPPTCPADGAPSDLTALANAADNLDPGCTTLYGIDILNQKLLDSLDLFQVNSQNYDDQFGWYAQWIKEQIQPQLDSFVDLTTGGGLQYMNCYVTVSGGQENETPCTNARSLLDDDVSWTIRFEVTDDDGFYNALEATTGVDRSWVVWGTENKPYYCDPDSSSSERPGASSGPCRRLYHNYPNYPLKAADSAINVGNPKALIEASMGNITALQQSISSTYLDLGLSTYSDGDDGGSPIDAIVAYSMPILQLSSAIASMREIKDIGEKAKEEAKKNLILKILSIVFMVIPFVGEALGPLVGSAAAVARIALIIGEAGNAALTVEGIVEDPASAPFAILGLVAGVGGAGGLKRADALAEASKVRTLMKDSDIAKFPDDFKAADSDIQNMFHKLCSLQ